MLEVLEAMKALEVMRCVLLCMPEVPEVMRRVLLCMLDAMRCMLLCILKGVEGGLYLLEMLEMPEAMHCATLFAGGVAGDVLCAALYTGGCGG